MKMNYEDYIGIITPKEISFLKKNGSLAELYPNALEFWDYDKNYPLIPNIVLSTSNRNVWWKCKTCGNSWLASFNSRANGQGCKVCGYKTVGNKVTKRSLNLRGSLYDNFPELMEEWDYELNKEINPQQIAISSRFKAWWKCKVCGFRWSAVVDSRTGKNHNGCPECNRKKEKSNLQHMTETYIYKNYPYELFHEFGCTVFAINPTTKKKLPFDNEIIIDNQHLIIEVNGDQHYRITNFTIYKSKFENITPEEELEKQKYRDQIKKDYIESLPNYHYLALPYWTFKDNSYKSLIDTAIHKILSTTQN